MLAFPKGDRHADRRQRRTAVDRAERQCYEIVDRRSGGRCEIVPTCTERATSHHHLEKRAHHGPKTMASIHNHRLVLAGCTRHHLWADLGWIDVKLHPVTLDFVATVTDLGRSKGIML